MLMFIGGFAAGLATALAMLIFISAWQATVCTERDSDQGFCDPPKPARRR